MRIGLVIDMDIDIHVTAQHLPVRTVLRDAGKRRQRIRRDGGAEPLDDVAVVVIMRRLEQYETKTPMHKGSLPCERSILARNRHGLSRSTPPPIAPKGISMPASSFSHLMTAYQRGGNSCSPMTNANSCLWPRAPPRQLAIVYRNEAVLLPSDLRVSAHHLTVASNPYQATLPTKEPFAPKLARSFEADCKSPFDVRVTTFRRIKPGTTKAPTPRQSKMMMRNSSFACPTSAGCRGDGRRPLGHESTPCQNSRDRARHSPGNPRPPGQNPTAYTSLWEQLRDEI